jgi:hypothetical protein
MELTVGSETSANQNMTPGKYPKENIQHIIMFASKLPCEIYYSGVVK